MKKMETFSKETFNKETQKAFVKNESVTANVEELHSILEAKGFEDFYLQVLSDANNYIESLEQDNTKLHALVGKLGDELILDEQIIIDKTDYTEEQFNLLAKVLGCTGAKEQITIYALDVKSV